jgi:membrane protease YdiL (CAAX protease family)
MFSIMKQNKSEYQNLWLFFLISLAFSWLFWIPRALISQGLSGPLILISFLSSPFNPAPFGPLVAAFSLTYWNEGRDGVIRLLKRGIDHRFGRIWFIPIFLLMPALTGTALLLSILGGEPAPDLPALYDPGSILVAFVYILLLGGPLEEEFGWRGYALDRLQARHSALLSSIMLGFVWGIWHLPLFFISGMYPYNQLPIQHFILGAILVSILFTWIYNNTRGSILAVLLFHTMHNLSLYLFMVLKPNISGLYYIVLITITVAVVLVIWGPERMARGRSRL